MFSKSATPTSIERQKQKYSEIFRKLKILDEFSSPEIIGQNTTLAEFLKEFQPKLPEPIEQAENKEMLFAYVIQFIKHNLLFSTTHPKIIEQEKQNAVSLSDVIGGVYNSLVNNLADSYETTALIALAILW